MKNYNFIEYDSDEISEILEAVRKGDFEKVVGQTLISLPHVISTQVEKAVKNIKSPGNGIEVGMLRNVSARWLGVQSEGEYKFDRTTGPVEGMVDCYASHIMTKLSVTKTEGKTNPHFRRNINVMAFDLMINDMQSDDISLPKFDESLYAIANSNRVEFDALWDKIKVDNKFVVAASKETRWDLQIEQAPYREFFTDENISRFKSFLRETDAKPYGRGAEFYTLITLSDGIPASKAGELVRFYTDEATGFWDAESGRNVNTITDIANLSLLRKLPSGNSQAAQFGSTFEPLAAAAYKQWYKQKHDVELVDLKSNYYARMVNTEVTGDYRQGTDGFYYDEVNKKYIVADFKMPQVFSGTEAKFNKRNKAVKNDYIYQTALYKSAAENVLPKNSKVESVVFEFGMKGLKNYLVPALSETDGQIMQKLKQRAVEGVKNADPDVRLTSHTINASPTLVNDLLLPAVEYYKSFLDKGVAPTDEWKKGKKYSPENEAVVNKLNHEMAMLKAMAEKITARNEGIKKIVNVRADRLGAKVQNHLSTTTESRRMPSGQKLYEKAVKQGFSVPKSEFVKSTESESAVVDASIVQSLLAKTDGKVGWDDVSTVSRVYKENKRYENKPAMELAADKVLQDINVASSPTTVVTQPSQKQSEYDGAGPSTQVV